ncbi:MAG: DUF308 domain-containing protein [Leucobacter sp.]
MTWELIPDSPQPDPSRAHSPGGRVPRQGRSPWWILLLIGVAVGLLGAALLIWPFFAGSRILAILVGAAFIGNGIAALVGTRIRALGAPAGILLLILGIIAIAFPEFTVRMLVSFVAVMMLMVGGIWLLIAIRMRAMIRPMFIVLPAVVVTLGVAALVWPSVALTLAALAAGAVTLLIGGSLIWGALALRRRRE